MKMTQILLLFFMLFFNKSEAQSCIGCDSIELRNNIMEIDGYYDINYQKTKTYKYYSSNKKYPLERIWQVENDTVVGYVLVLRKEGIITQVNKELDAQYKRLSYGKWLISEHDILITLEYDMEESVPFYLFRKHNL